MFLETQINTAKNMQAEKQTSDPGLLPKVRLTWLGSNKPIEWSIEALKARLDTCRQHEWDLRAYFLQNALREQVGCAHHCEVRVLWSPNGPDMTPNPRKGAHLNDSDQNLWIPGVQVQRCWAALLCALNAQPLIAADVGRKNNGQIVHDDEHRRATNKDVHLIMSQYSPLDVAVGNVTWCKWSYVCQKFYNLPTPLQLNFEVALAAARRCSATLRYVPSPDLRNKVVNAIISENGWALFHASPALQDCKELVLKAVNQNWQALEHASSRLRNDKDVVLAALKQNGYALQFASKDLQNNEVVAFTALCSPLCKPSTRDTNEYMEWRQGPVLKFVSEALRAHPLLGPLLVLFAVARDNRSWRYTTQLT